MATAEPSISVELRRDVIDVRTRGHHIPDPKWSHVDAHGHEHRFDEEGNLPTLEWVVTGVFWCDSCRDEHEEGEWRCRLCSDVVEPRYGWSGEQRFNLPGLAEWILTVDGREFPIPITVDEARELSSIAGDELRDRALAIARDRGIVSF